MKQPKCFFYESLQRYFGCLAVDDEGKLQETIVSKIYNFNLEFFINSYNQGQFCNLLVMRILKLSLLKRFDEKFSEIFKVKVITQFKVIAQFQKCCIYISFTCIRD